VNFIKTTAKMKLSGPIFPRDREIGNLNTVHILHHVVIMLLLGVSLLPVTVDFICATLE